MMFAEKRMAKIIAISNQKGGQKGNKARRKRIVPWTISFVLNKY